MTFWKSKKKGDPLAPRAEEGMFERTAEIDGVNYDDEDDADDEEDEKTQLLKGARPSPMAAVAAVRRQPASSAPPPVPQGGRAQLRPSPSAMPQMTPPSVSRAPAPTVPRASSPWQPPPPPVSPAASASLSPDDEFAFDDEEVASEIRSRRAPSSPGRSSHHPRTSTPPEGAQGTPSAASSRSSRAVPPPLEDEDDISGQPMPRRPGSSPGQRSGARAAPSADAAARPPSLRPSAAAAEDGDVEQDAELDFENLELEDDVIPAGATIPSADVKLVADEPNENEEDLDAEGRARKIELVIFDVDGTLTDGGLFYGPQGEVLKRFSAQDGHGIILARRVGLGIAILTARSSRIVETRARELGIDLVFQGRKDKLAGFDEVLAAAGVRPDHVAYMGDDLNDLGVLLSVGLSACPADACIDVADEVDFVSSRNGGDGAAREFLEFILKAQGKWKSLVDASSGKH